MADGRNTGGKWGSWWGWVIGLAVVIGTLAGLEYAVPCWPGLWQPGPGMDTSRGNSPIILSPSVVPTNYPATTVAFSSKPSPTPKLIPSPTTAVPSPTPSPTPKPTASPTATVTSSPNPQPTAMLRPSPTPMATMPTFTPTLPPALTASPTVSTTIAPLLPLMDVPPCSPPSASSHLWMAHPIPPEANDWASTYYPYGSTAGGEYLIHHGVDLVNPEGTPVLAAGAGTVFYAGDDRERVFGPQPNFYGRLVIVRMDREYHGQPVFTLYGHLSAIVVQEGQGVEMGQKLGEVGATGIALGSHLHFEVRVTDPYGYYATRNPELWIGPHPGRGLIAGQVLGEDGEPLPEVRLALYPAHDPQHPQREGWTYASRGVNSDEEWFENLVWGDVPAGEWAVVAHLPGQRLRQRVTVRPGEISWVCLQPPAGPTKVSPGKTSMSYLGRQCL